MKAFKNWLSALRDLYHTKILRRKYYRSGKCNCCGRCCEKIYVKHGRAVLNDESLFEKLKLMHSFYDDLICIDKDEIGLVFSCKNLDAEDGTNERKCKKHKTRAKICRDYPQEELFMIGGSMGEDCGYKFTPIISFAQTLMQCEKKDRKKSDKKS